MKFKLLISVQFIFEKVLLKIFWGLFKIESKRINLLWDLLKRYLPTILEKAGYNLNINWKIYESIFIFLYVIKCRIEHQKATLISIEDLLEGE